MATVCVFMTFLLQIYFVSSSLYDPHRFPGRGPFIEGWYIRISDSVSSESYAVLFGTVLPQSSSTGSNLAYIGILRSDGLSTMKNKDAFPSLSTVVITKNGRRDYGNPDVNTAPDFEWRAPPYGYITVNATNAVVDVTIDDVSLKAVIGVEDPWSGNTHLGPEHWLVKLPLPIHWFVYSLASQTTYTFTNITRAETINGIGTAHMEKNWGNGFPESWFWAQGHRETDGVTLALTGGWLKFGPIPVRGHLAGYRNQKRRISLDFRPDNSVMSVEVNGCRGQLRAAFTSVSHFMAVKVASPRSSFSQCLYGPMSNGFRKVSSESYKARIRVELYRRRYYVAGDFILIDTQIIDSAALEFGGSYLCHICSP